MKAWKHFCTITHHKWLVMKGCFKVGLYRQGLFHDMSKYSPAEFLVGCKYFQGNKSPNNAEREAKGYSSAWLHHKGRNKHHLEYWIDYAMPPEKGMTGMRMPDKYVVEMFMDRIAASKVYQKEKYTDRSPLEKTTICSIPRPGLCWNSCLTCWQRRERKRPLNISGSMY